MKSPKSSYIFAGLTAFALVLVLASARKPLPASTSKPISWLTIDEVPAKLKEQPKPILIDLYTTWCGWCKQMDHRTYSNKKVIQYLGDKFYTVRLDAETHHLAGKNLSIRPPIPLQYVRSLPLTRSAGIPHDHHHRSRPGTPGHPRLYGAQSHRTIGEVFW
jgi:thiol-disulfide isomerase/thioredoxin